MPTLPTMVLALLLSPLSPLSPLASPGPLETSTSRSEPPPVAPSRDGVWPLQPRPPVVAGFAPPSTPFGAGHRGVDLLGHTGQEVHTTLPGRVRFAAMLAGRGVVVVDHGTVRTTYEPVVAGVRAGEVLARGDVLGVLAGAGSHCWPRDCLHWGLLSGRTYLDPLSLVGAGPVRLLPLDTTGSAPATLPVARWWGTGVDPGPPVPARLPAHAV